MNKPKKIGLKLLPEENNPIEKEGKESHLNTNFNHQGLKFLGIHKSFRYLFYAIFISLIAISNSLSPGAPYITLIAKSEPGNTIKILNANFDKNLCYKELYINGAPSFYAISKTNCLIYSLNKKERKNPNIYTLKIVFPQDIKQMSSMFEGLVNILEVDLSYFHFSTVTKTDNLFKGCTSLTSVNFAGASSPNLITMMGMFYGCSSLINVNLSDLDTTKVTSMNSLFYNCNNLKSVEFGDKVTSSVNTMSNMFYNCQSLEELKINNFDTSSVTDIAICFMNVKI